MAYDQIKAANYGSRDPGIPGPGIDSITTTLSAIHDKISNLHNATDSIIARLSHIRTELYGPVPEAGSALLKEVQSGLLPGAHRGLDALREKLATIEGDLHTLAANLL